MLSDRNRRFAYGDTSQPDSKNVVCLASWIAEGPPSEWITAGNGLQYRIQMLTHCTTAGRLGRGKCYDLSQFSDADRERIEPALKRHPDVLERLRRHRSFPDRTDCGLNGAHHFWVVDDYDDSLTLTEYVQQKAIHGAGLPLEETLNIMKQVAQALRVLHQRKIIRRGLTPDSILIQPDGHVLLTDLELCKLLGEHPTVVPEKFPKSPWLAPELSGMPWSQIPDTEAWEAVDVYSWGRIFLYVATGKVPPESLNRMCDVIPMYPPEIQEMLGRATFAGYRTRPSISEALGAWERMGRIANENHPAD